MNQNKRRNREVNLSELSNKGRRRKKRNRRLVVINVVTSIVLVFSIAMMSGMLALNIRFNDTTVGGDDGGTTSDPAQDLESVIVSSHEDVTYFLVAGLDESESLTDILMVVCFDHGKNEANILQIPRDTFIGSDVTTGKVNAVYGSAKKGQSKINKLIRRINTHFGLPIDHYVTVTLEAFRNIVDAVGGVDIYLPNRLRVADSDTDGDYHNVYYIGPGMTHLTGAQAEGFMRNRSGKGYANGDMSRLEAQRNLYAAFTQKVMNMSLSQMMKIATSCYDKVKTDLSVGEMLGYASQAKQLTMDKIKIHAVPGQGGYFTPDGMHQRLSYYSVHKDEYVELVNTYFLPYDDKITSSSIEIEQLHDQEYADEIEDGTDFGSLNSNEGG